MLMDALRRSALQQVSWRAFSWRVSLPPQPCRPPRDSPAVRWPTWRLAFSCSRSSASPPSSLVRASPSPAWSAPSSKLQLALSARPCGRPSWPPSPLFSFAPSISWPCVAPFPSRQLSPALTGARTIIVTYMLLSIQIPYPWRPSLQRAYLPDALANPARLGKQPFLVVLQQLLQLGIGSRRRLFAEQVGKLADLGQLHARRYQAFA